MFRNVFRASTRQLTRARLSNANSRRINGVLFVGAAIPAFGLFMNNKSQISNDQINEKDVDYKPQLLTTNDLKTDTTTDQEKGHENVEEKKQVADEEEAPQGAFNPETGEINWDCPCLGGMADGPCGEEFKAAFSCFVYSTEEPKGVECIDKFSAMQNCFRQHPEHYAEELRDESPLDDPAASEKFSQTEQDRSDKDESRVLPDDKLTSHDENSNKKVESWGSNTESKESDKSESKAN